MLLNFPPNTSLDAMARTAGLTAAELAQAAAMGLINRRQYPDGSTDLDLPDNRMQDGILRLNSSDFVMRLSSGWGSICDAPEQAPAPLPTSAFTATPRTTTPAPTSAFTATPRSATPVPASAFKVPDRPALPQRRTY